MNVNFTKKDIATLEINRYLDYKSELSFFKDDAYLCKKFEGKSFVEVYDKMNTFINTLG